MCTDVAMYLVYSPGTRLIPMPPPEVREAYFKRCGKRTALMYLETMYNEIADAKHNALKMFLVGAAPTDARRQRASELRGASPADDGNAQRPGRQPSPWL